MMISRIALTLSLALVVSCSDDNSEQEDSPDFRPPAGAKASSPNAARDAYATAMDIDTGTDLDYPTLKALAVKYAPIVEYDQAESYFADDVAVTLANANALRGDWYNTVKWTSSPKSHRDMGTWFIQSKARLKGPSDIFSWFSGRDPKAPGYADPPVYTVVTGPDQGWLSGQGFDKPGWTFDAGCVGEIPCTPSKVTVPDAVDFMITYFFSYPYNRGKDPTFCSSSALSTSLHTVIGNHVGDLERVSVLFKYDEKQSASPVAVRYDYHSWENYFRWGDNAAKGAGGPTKYERVGNRPVAYSADGGHGSWWYASDAHEYVWKRGPKNICGTLLLLADVARGGGGLWNTFNNVFLITQGMWAPDKNGTTTEITAADATALGLNAESLGLTSYEYEAGAPYPDQADLGSVQPSKPLTHWFTQIRRWGNAPSLTQGSCGTTFPICSLLTGGDVICKSCINLSRCGDCGFFTCSGPCKGDTCSSVCLFNCNNILEATAGECRLEWGPSGMQTKEIFNHTVKPLPAKP